MKILLKVKNILTYLDICDNIYIFATFIQGNAFKRMKKLLILLSAIYVLSMQAAYGQIMQTWYVGTDDTEGRTIMVAPMDDRNNYVELTVEGNGYKGKVTESKNGFYNLISVKGYSQTIIPLYLAKGEQPKFQLDFEDNGRLLLKGSNDNMALAAYGSEFSKSNRDLWRADTVSADYSRGIIKHLVNSADSIASQYKCTPDVKAYLDVWSYISAYDCYTSLPRILRIKAKDMPFKYEEVLPQPHTVLNSPMATLFTNAPNVVYASLPDKNNLDSALVFLQSHYTDSGIVQAVKDNIAARYVSRYNYGSGDFDAGLERLRKATEKYALDPKYAADFAKRKATVPGQPFPKNVVLKDTLGNTVDFAKFRGKYVYIDVWASWCVPCIKEVPHLQKMERELKNKNVVFLSVSIDAKESAWKQKMTQLGLHGNQLHNPGNTLCESLNVKGIPFFVIYDPQGKLYMHGAPRSSQGRGVVELLEGLK